MWKQGLPPLLRGRRDEHDTADAPQQLKQQSLLQNCSLGLRHVHRRQPAFAMHPADQYGNNIAEKHTARDEGRADDEEHPGEGNCRKTDPTEKTFGHLGV